MQLKKKFKNTFKVSNNHINKFILLLRKRVHSNEYMDERENFNVTLLPEKEEFYRSLNIEDITDVDYMHAKKFVKTLKKNLYGYDDLYLKNDTLLLADVFEKFREMCLRIYHLDPSKLLSAPGLAWQTALKNTEVKLELLTGIDMVLMIEKGIRGEKRHAIHRYAKANNKYMNDYGKKRIFVS